MNSRTHDSAAILVIDSDALMLTAVSAVLHISGYECHCARDAEAAVKAVRGLTLDLVICDVDLDREDGWELCRELRQTPGCAELPLILVSREQTEDIVRRTHDAGATYYLRKPYDPEVLLELVDKALWVPHLVSTRIEQQSSHQPSSPALFAGRELVANRQRAESPAAFGPRDRADTK
jgi:DNA-binding response OmpR family regulator